MCPRTLGFFVMTTFDINSHENNSILRTNTNGHWMMDYYCHFQIHAVHMQSSHNKRSKCPPYTVKQDVALLISWYIEWSYRGNRATCDTCWYDISSLVWSTERISKIWPPISDMLCSVLVQSSLRRKDWKSHSFPMTILYCLSFAKCQWHCKDQRSNKRS
jgi:hypothetical protein